MFEKPTHVSLIWGDSIELWVVTKDQVQSIKDMMAALSYELPEASRPCSQEIAQSLIVAVDDHLASQPAPNFQQDFNVVPPTLTQEQRQLAVQKLKKVVNTLHKAHRAADEAAKQLRDIMAFKVDNFGKAWTKAEDATKQATERVISEEKPHYIVRVGGPPPDPDLLLANWALVDMYPKQNVFDMAQQAASYAQKTIGAIASISPQSRPPKTKYGRLTNDVCFIFDRYGVASADSGNNLVVRVLDELLQELLGDSKASGRGEIRKLLKKINSKNTLAKTPDKP